MNDRIRAEIDLVMAEYPDLEFRESDLWARLPAYPIPPGWGVDSVEVAFQAPQNLPGQEPYGFWVRPPLELPGGGQPTNATGPVSTGFGDGWQQFSWSFDGWQPGVEPQQGTNLLDWVRSFTRRLREVN